MSKGQNSHSSMQDLLNLIYRRDLILAGTGLNFVDYELTKRTLSSRRAIQIYKN